MRFNRQQQEAIQTIDRNIALVAGAGTGKTAVLTERFITLLKKGTLPKNRALSSIAAITFTEKAADEMKKRIQDRLQTEQTHLPLRGQHDFRISTIHGFCARILRDDPAGAGVDPLFTVLEEAEAQKMLTGAMTEAYARLVIDADEGMLIRHAWHAHNAFLSDAVQLYHRLRAGAVDRERVHKNSTAYPGYAKERDSCLKDKLLQYLKTAGKNQKLYKFLTENGGETEITQSKESRLKLVSLLVQADPFGTAKGVAEIKDMVYHCAADSETEFKQAGDFLFALLAEADRIYTADKKRKAGLDYDDLQEKALCRLRDPEALRAWQDEIRYLMVDECQDINDMQKEIFYALCTKEKPLDRNNLFVVGDPRQSIYGFRYARAELFEQLQKDVTDSGGAVLSMSTNYRCSPEIISYVNGVFRPYFPKLEELQAGGDAKHVCIEWCAGEDKESITPEADAARVCDKVAELLHNGEAPNDIGLLFRSSARMHLYENELKRAGIPCVNLSSKSFWNRQEVLDLLAAVLVATNSADTVWWLAFLRSPFAGVSDRELLSWNAYGDNWEERLIGAKYKAKKAEAVLARIREYRERLRLDSLPCLVTDLRREYDVYCAAEPDAERRLANLDALLAWLYDRQEQDNPAPEQLAEDWLWHTGVEEEEAEQADTEGGAVTLMTIHKAKGLEKRVIFLVGIDANTSGFSDAFLYDENRVYIKGSAGHALAGKRQRQREEEEERRILYVALTRAKESLYLTSHTGKNQSFYKTLKEAGYDPAGLPAMHTQKPAAMPQRKARAHVKPVRFTFPNPPLQTRAFSASQWMQFLSCKRAWYLQYKLFIHADPPTVSVLPDEEAINTDYRLAGHKKGSLFHALAEAPDDVDPESQIHALARRYGVEPSAKEIAQLKTWLHHVRTYPFQGQTAHEQDFDWERNGFLWTGSVDLVEDGPVFRIYDFKTNQKKAGLTKYIPQMQLYALAMRALTGRVPEAVLWWLPGNEQIPVDVSDAALQKAEEQMDAFTSYVTRQTDWAAYPCTESCPAYCRSKNLCDALSE